MLKKELIAKMRLLEEMIIDKDRTLNEQVDDLRSKAASMKELRDKVSEFRRLQKHVSDAIVAIDAVAQVNCRENVEFQRNGHMIIEDAKREGKDPEWPEITPLYSTLTHIASILHRRIEKEEELGYNRFR